MLGQLKIFENLYYRVGTKIKGLIPSQNNDSSPEQSSPIEHYDMKADDQMIS